MKKIKIWKALSGLTIDFVILPRTSGIRTSSLALGLASVVFLSSCTVQEMISDTMEFEFIKGLQNAQKPKGSHLSAKEKAQEAERLKKEGICPSCRGFGKTPDGRFTCVVCNGTGKYQEKQHKDTEQ